MPTRIVYGLVVVAALVTLFLLDRSADGWLLAGLVVAAACLGLRELFRLLPPVEPAVRIAVFATAVATILAPMAGWSIAGVFAAPIAIALASLAGPDPRRSVSSLTTGLAAWIYLGLFPAAFVCLRQFGLDGWGLVATALVATKCADIGAYFTGRAIGKTPLVPRLSPKKTVEGLCGGLALAAFGGWLVAKPLGAVDSFGALEALAFGAVLGAVGTLGDLLESQLKRAADVKDSGSVLPEFGGILDMIDSPLLTAPAALAWVILF